MKRRSFLKGTATLGAASAMPSFVFGEAANTALVKNGEVITGAHWGILKATVKDGKIVKSEAWKKTSNVPNPLQTAMDDLVYKARIKAPMVRKSYLENPDSPKPELRGKDEWVEVPYEEAIKLVAKELKKTREQKGMNSICAGSYAWQSSGALGMARTLLHRFMNLTGGFVGVTGDFSTGAAQVILPHVKSRRALGYESNRHFAFVIYGF